MYFFFFSTHTHATYVLFMRARTNILWPDAQKTFSCRKRATFISNIHTRAVCPKEVSIYILLYDDLFIFVFFPTPLDPTGIYARVSCVFSYFFFFLSLSRFRLTSAQRPSTKWRTGDRRPRARPENTETPPRPRPPTRPGTREMANGRSRGRRKPRPPVRLFST